METVFRLKASELDLSFIKMLKRLLGKNNNIEVLINVDKKISKALRPETKEETKARIDKAIEYVESGGKLINFTGEEFEELTKNLLKK